MERELLPLLVGLASGVAAGGLYFFWLWRSLHGLGSRRRPALRIAAGVMGRLAFALAAFGLLARWGGLAALVGALAGFTATRLLLVHRVSRADAEKRA